MGVRPVPDLVTALVLFDLDGTLVDSSPGIAASLAAAADGAGVPRPDADQVRALLGPPFPQAFVDVLGHDPATAEAMMDAYREVYAAGGLYDVTVFDGVPAMLARLAKAGHRPALTTSKPDVYAREVLRHVGLDAAFDAGVFGATLDGSLAGKAAVVDLALQTCDGPVVALVGDRHHDVDGAHAHDLPAVGVTWGFGGAAELRAAGADHLVDSPAALGELLEQLAAVCPAR
ncbi:HAD hydrolase-like protein [Actinomycetospora sp. NBRC 106375]|uniref:HAD hydrolase-like protein n=1 Tax=Actinomycetospora sp. NBRC 106375 TaxID=3032207 RepID=UPI002553E93B|nr:HAD hydrolase-like protein [Actinomycetospora sp. NBRC 106375]